MNTTAAIASPISRENLRNLASIIRQKTGMSDIEFFPIIEFMELVLPKLYDDYHFEIGTMSEMDSLHGISCFSEKYIKLREDVYEGALNGNGRDRFTCAHEVGHFLLHNDNSVKLGRLAYGQKLKPYRDPEWQADAFAGELLIPHNIVSYKGYDVNDISQLCGVSIAAARTQLNIIRRI